MTIPPDLPPSVPGADGSAIVSARSGPARRAGEPVAAERPAATGDGDQDRIELSEFARLVHRATDQVRASPAERADLIASLRAEIDAGTYTVDARLVAERLLAGLVTA